MPNAVIPAGNAQLEHWIRAISQRDRDALASLYRATSSAVYAYALSILQNPIDAEDALHDTYVSLWDCAADYRPQGKPMAWIMTVTRNLCLKQLRQQKWHTALADSVPIPPGADPADALMLRSCMQILTDEERQIVVLHAIAELKHRQIAQLLGLKLSTVLSKYNRAIQKLKKEAL